MLANQRFKRIVIPLFDFFLNAYFIFFISLFITNYSFFFSYLNSKFSFPLEDISNISVQTGIFVFLLFLRWLLDKKSFLSIKFIRIIKNIEKFDDKIILFAIFVIFVIIYSSLGIARHLSLSSSGYDLGITVQAIWNTINGNALFSSMHGHINYLGNHFSSIFFLIAPLYAIWPDAALLIYLQSVALGSAILPLYLIARHYLNSRALIFAFIISYCLSPIIKGIGLLDFHTEAFILPLILFCYYFLIKRRTCLFLFSLFLMLMCKEDTAFIAVAFGIFTFIFQRRFKFGGGLSITWDCFLAVIN